MREYPLPDNKAHRLRAHKSTRTLERRRLIFRLSLIPGIWGECLVPPETRANLTQASQCRIRLLPSFVPQDRNVKLPSFSSMLG